MDVVEVSVTLNPRAGVMVRGMDQTLVGQNGPKVRMFLGERKTTLHDLLCGGGDPLIV